MKINSSKTVKRIFLFFIFYLPIQYMLVGVVGVLYSEPWPAFVLPGFKSIYANQDYVEITEPRFVGISSDSTEQQTEIEISTLFKGLPTSQTQGFLRSNFSSQRTFSPEAQNWFKQRLKKIYPEKNYNRLQIEWVQISYLQQEDEVQIAQQEVSHTLTISLPEN